MDQEPEITQAPDNPPANGPPRVAETEAPHLSAVRAAPAATLRSETQILKELPVAEAETQRLLQEIQKDDDQVDDQVDKQSLLEQLKVAAKQRVRLLEELQVAADCGGTERAENKKRLLKEIQTAAEYRAAEIQIDVKEISEAFRSREKLERELEEKQQLVQQKKKLPRRVWNFVRDKKRRLPKLSLLRKKVEPTDIDSVLPHPYSLPYCYEEIKKLLLIERSPVYAKALHEWTRKETLFTSRVERKKKKVANLKNEIYQLIGFFSVFQGVLLTAVAQSNLLHCNNRWSPIVLSLVASIAVIAGVVQKLLQISDLQKTIHSEEQSLKEVVGRGQKLRREGPENFVFAKFSAKNLNKHKKFLFWIYLLLIGGTLVFFTLAFPISHWRILCYPGRNPYSPA